jgi:hypothetical protein
MEPRPEEDPSAHTIPIVSEKTYTRLHTSLHLDLTDEQLMETVDVPDTRFRNVSYEQPKYIHPGVHIAKRIDALIPRATTDPSDFVNILTEICEQRFSGTVDNSNSLAHKALYGMLFTLDVISEEAQKKFLVSSLLSPLYKAGRLNPQHAIAFVRGIPPKDQPLPQLPEEQTYLSRIIDEAGNRLVQQYSSLPNTNSIQLDAFRDGATTMYHGLAAVWPHLGIAAKQHG